jgi:peroxiredoxin
VLAVSADTPRESRAMAEELSLPFALLSDPPLQVVRAYGVEQVGAGIALPSAFVIAPGGRVIFSYVGRRATDRPPVRRLLDALRRARATR